MEIYIEFEEKLDWRTMMWTGSWGTFFVFIGILFPPLLALIIFLTGTHFYLKYRGLRGFYWREGAKAFRLGISCRSFMKV